MLEQGKRPFPPLLKIAAEQRKVAAGEHLQELRTHLGGRRKGYVFERNRADKYTTRYV